MNKKKRLFFKIAKRVLNFLQSTSLRPAYKVVLIEENNKGYYEATIQLTGKNITYKIKPEEILADDKMTSQFSQHDIRTLTYLGYLGMNSPKYRILARRLAENDQMLFLIHEKGKSAPENQNSRRLIQKHQNFRKNESKRYPSHWIYKSQ